MDGASRDYATNTIGSDHIITDGITDGIQLLAAAGTIIEIT